ncbi:MAG: hypothetical protein ACR65R_14775 [Methylomicrobium sp.]
MITQQNNLSSSLFSIIVTSASTKAARCWTPQDSSVLRMPYEERGPAKTTLLIYLWLNIKNH